MKRSPIDYMILAFTALICLVVVGSATLITVLEIRDPATDTSQMVEVLDSMITGILGALLGLLAGRSEK